MDISYNLRYQKQNFANRVIVDKEGEIIIYGKGFRLKGKGATDKGELINFSEIKEFYYRNDKIFFITFNKEKYTLSDAGTQFGQLIVDIYKARNEFLMDALFMKGGKLKAEFEGYFQRVSKFAKPINKGNAKLRIYESSMVVIPSSQDAFSLHFNFVNSYEFEDLEYTLKVVMDDETTIFFSQLGNDFELFQEKMETALGGMYGTVVNDILKEVFMEFHSAVLLKLAYKMKGGKAVSLKEIQKIDKDLASAVENFIFKDDNVLKEKMSVLKKITDENNVFYGIAKDDTVKNSYIRWLMYSIVDKNIVAFCILPRWISEGQKDSSPQNVKYETYFYKIIMEQGTPALKVEDKLREINQALVNLHFVKDPCYKDKRELKHSPYQYAIRKLPYLRILRKSFIGQANAADAKEWQKQAEEILKCSSL
ncbi:hypothetical protein A3B60_04120 [Candidatus Peregrinibacteria bacterium RIFCSPLOWO2_01_FULL_39_12]|nr:MAG: hypothetical protein A3B60_04120 [Candidatus Peregrinibacteria bacterium RIFCSPLOWO2_01_FULL_39_12]OGJ43758.1 MAG: hypothetical protein A3I58_03620 [Candidatus Peregrinibacteria bacterium RIFCSPLOWO2_02_FULL_39_10]